MPEYVSTLRSRRAHRRRRARDVIRRLKNSPVRRCRICGCTDANACITPEGPCCWVGADLCSNPECLAKVTVSIVSKEQQAILGYHEIAD